MRQLRYLNAVLTVIAVLLTMNLYVAWSVSPGVATGAHAAESGLVNAGAQRKEMIDLLKQLNVSMDEMKTALTDGSIRVTTQNAD